MSISEQVEIMLETAYQERKTTDQVVSEIVLLLANVIDTMRPKTEYIVEKDYYFGMGDGYLATAVNNPDLHVHLYYNRLRDARKHAQAALEQTYPAYDWVEHE